MLILSVNAHFPGHYINYLPDHQTPPVKQENWPLPFSPYPLHNHSARMAERANRQGQPFCAPPYSYTSNLDDLRLFGRCSYILCLPRG